MIALFRTQRVLTCIKSDDVRWNPASLIDFLCLFGVSQFLLHTLSHTSFLVHMLQCPSASQRTLGIANGSCPTFHLKIKSLMVRVNLTVTMRTTCISRQNC